MGTQPLILRKGNKFKSKMTSLEFLAYSKTRGADTPDSGYHKPGRDENGDPVKHFNGSATAVKGLRTCFQDLLGYTDPRFTGRLMKITTEIYNRDTEGECRKRSVYFSRERRFLENIVFNARFKSIDYIDLLLMWQHSEDRTAATLKFKDFIIKDAIVPASATHFRILHQMSVISDYAFSEYHQCYEPLSKLNGLSVMAFTDYVPRWSVMNEELKISFPAGTHLSKDDSVIECLGVEFYMPSGGSFIELKGGSVKVVDIF